MKPLIVIKKITFFSLLVVLSSVLTAVSIVLLLWLVDYHPFQNDAKFSDVGQADQQFPDVVRTDEVYCRLGQELTFDSSLAVSSCGHYQSLSRVRDGLELVIDGPAFVCLKEDPEPDSGREGVSLTGESATVLRLESGPQKWHLYYVSQAGRYLIPLSVLSPAVTRLHLRVFPGNGLEVSGGIKFRGRLEGDGVDAYGIRAKKGERLLFLAYRDEGAEDRHIALQVNQSSKLLSFTAVAGTTLMMARTEISEESLVSVFIFSEQLNESETGSYDLYIKPLDPVHVLSLGVQARESLSYLGDSKLFSLSSGDGFGVRVRCEEVEADIRVLSGDRRELLDSQRCSVGTIVEFSFPGGRDILVGLASVRGAVGNFSIFSYPMDDD